MQREDVERLARVCCQTGHNYMTATEAPAALLALLERAEKAEAERDAAFAAGHAAGQVEMRERAAEKCRWHSDRLVEDIRALPIKPRP